MAERKKLAAVEVNPDTSGEGAVIVIETEDGTVHEFDATLEQLDDLADALDLFGEAEEGDDEEVEA